MIDRRPCGSGPSSCIIASQPKNTIFDIIKQILATSLPIYGSSSDITPYHVLSHVTHDFRSLSSSLGLVYD